MIPSRRELYRSHNGDSWFLARDPSDGHVFILHEPNLPSGGHRSQIEIGDFLRAGGNSAEHQALVKQSRKKQLTKVPRELRGKDNSGG